MTIQRISSSRPGGIALLLAIAAFGYVALRVVLCKAPDFDGSSGLIAAQNLYRTGFLKMNQPPHIYMQTNLPFQVVNGFFIFLIGNSFLTANLANVFFLALLLCIFIELSKMVESDLPLFSFTAFVLSPIVIAGGFSGFGELPALVFVVSGGMIVAKEDIGSSRIIAGGVLIGLGCATKYIALLCWPALLLALLLSRFGFRRSALLVAVSGLTFLASFLYQHLPYGLEEIQMLFSRVVGANQVANTEVTRLVETFNGEPVGRYEVLWSVISESSYPAVAVFKAFLVLLLAGLLAREILVRGGNRPKAVTFTFHYLCAFLLVYLSWYFLLNNRPWERRFLNSDILIFANLALLPALVPLEKRYLEWSLGFLAVIYFCVSLPSLSSCAQCNVSCREAIVREGLSNLPSNYRGYGFSMRMAPRWSFLADRVFFDLFASDPFFDCFERGCQNYLFLDGTRNYQAADFARVENAFELAEVWSDRKAETGDAIFEIKGFRRTEKKPAPEIDFSSSNALAHFTALRVDHDGAGVKLPLGAAAFLEAQPGSSCLHLELETPTCFLGRKLLLGLASGETRAIHAPALVEGHNHIMLPLSAEIAAHSFDLYLLPELENKPSPEPASVVSDCTIIFGKVSTGSCEGGQGPFGEVGK
jgi:hypothetical protein